MPGRETKQRILEASSELFAAHGYDDVTMRGIAKKVGITEGAIYRHFESKAQILDEIISLLSKKVKWIFHVLDKEQMDKYIKTESPRQVLERCKIQFSKEDFVFLGRAFSIALQEHLTNSTAKELVVYKLYHEFSNRIKYVLDRLQESGSIPKFNTSAFSLLWTRFAISTLSLWIAECTNGMPPEEAEVDYECTIDWLIESALSGKVQ